MGNKRLLELLVMVLPLVLSVKQIYAEDVRSYAGPVSVVLENLAYNTASITDELRLQLSTKIERTSSSLLGHIETITAAAMAQLSEPLFEANNKLAAGECPQNWTMDELRARVDLQLSNCTQQLSDLMHTFQTEADAVANTIQSYVNDIVSLPVVCQLLSGGNFSFSSSSSCFVHKMVDINQSVGGELNRASEMMTRTRQLTKSSVVNAQQCAEDVVAGTLKYVEKSLENC